MRTRFSAPAAILLVLALAAPAHGQDAPAYSEVSQVELAPADASAFLEAVKTVRDAATEVNLDARFAWDAYRWDNTIYFVTWHESLANLEDPEAFVRAFQGTEVADRVMAAFQSTGPLDVEGGMSEVNRARPDLGYVPESPAVQHGQHEGVLVIRQWPAGGDPAPYEESVKGFMSMLSEMDAPYPVFVSQNMVGRGGFVIAVPFESMSSFYGENSLPRGLAEAGMGDRWSEHEAAHRKLISNAESFHVWYLPEHSYRPDDM